MLWWLAFAAPYNELLANLAEPLLRAFERPAVTRLVPTDGNMMVDRTDFRRVSARPAIRPTIVMSPLTVNFILLTALFAVNRQPFSTRNVGLFLLAGIILMVVHVVAVIVNVHSLYALRLGPWSERHYGAVSRSFWGVSANFYFLVGSSGCAFALWWLFRPVPEGSRRSTDFT